MATEPDAVAAAAVVGGGRLGGTLVPRYSTFVLTIAPSDGGN